MNIVHYPYLKSEWNLKRPETDKKVALISRYGGLGDMLMISPYIRQLSEQGYYTVVLTTTKSWTTLLNNPYLDEMWVHQRHDMYDSDLPDIIEYVEQFCDVHINTTFVVENNLLVMALSPEAMPEMTPVRRKKCNVNYAEAYGKRFREAGVDVVDSNNLEFYPQRHELRQADRLIKKGKGKKILYFMLVGSSVHKVWPYVTQFLMEFRKKHPDWFVITSGDYTAKLVQEELKKIPGVLTTAGMLDVRVALTLAQKADLVIGPETGIINLAGALDVPTIVFLSHSTEENLTKYWKNTIALKTGVARCYPCHILHNQGFKSCARDNTTGAAWCQATIYPNEVHKAVEELLNDNSK